MVNVDDVLKDESATQKFIEKYLFRFDLSDIEYLTHLYFKVKFLDSNKIQRLYDERWCFDSSKMKAPTQNIEEGHEDELIILGFEGEDLSNDSSKEPCRYKTHEYFSIALRKYFKQLFPHVDTDKKQRIRKVTIDYDKRRYNVINDEVFEVSEQTIIYKYTQEFHKFKYKVCRGNVYSFPSKFTSKMDKRKLSSKFRSIYFC
eukprot:GAHX01002443.1.p1 GENE.GAHX01002443.1~~GAHX01002443.1.p1  ORF type:complete len:202 (+),score=28.82 GAHX01002443.1:345-950(+)